ncbi:hypothetical protein H4R19_004298, partial [Coemansia spiralis]
MEQYRYVKVPASTVTFQPGMRKRIINLSIQHSYAVAYVQRFVQYVVIFEIERRFDGRKTGIPDVECTKPIHELIKASEIRSYYVQLTDTTPGEARRKAQDNNTAIGWYLRAFMDLVGEAGKPFVAPLMQSPSVLAAKAGMRISTSIKNGVKAGYSRYLYKLTRTILDVKR